MIKLHRLKKLKENKKPAMIKLRNILEKGYWWPGSYGRNLQDVSLNVEISDVEKRLQFEAEEITKLSGLQDQLLDRSNWKKDEMEDQASGLN